MPRDYLNFKLPDIMIHILVKPLQVLHSSGRQIAVDG